MKKFKIVVIDYPWQYWSWSDKGQDRSPNSKYDVMGLDHYDRLQKELTTICDPDCLYFHWVTTPMVMEFAKVALKWETTLNLTYRAMPFVWGKLKKSYNPDQLAMMQPDMTDPSNWFMGMGYYTRCNAELVYLFRDARQKALERTNLGVHQMIVTPVGEHSVKPDTLFERIDSLYGNIESKLEIFARQPRQGWSTWGNAIDGKNIFDVIHDYRQLIEEQR